MFKKRSLLLPVVILIVAIPLGCSSANDKTADTRAQEPLQPSAAKTFEPVTLTVGQTGAYFSDPAFQQLVADPVKKKYPHITVKLVSGVNIEKVVLTGEIPDLYVGDPSIMMQLKLLQLLTDVTPLAAAHHFDFGRIAPAKIQYIKNLGDGSTLNAFPHSVYAASLHYNKDIFDRFGVAYPKDGMTWEEALALAAKLTRNDQGTRVYGLGLSTANVFNSTSGDFVDAKSDAVKVTGPVFVKAFNLAKQIYFPGNDYSTANSGNMNQFMKDRNLAMLGDKFRTPYFIEVPDLNWDLAQYPSFSDTPNVGFLGNMDLIAPVKTSQHRDDLMRVIEVYLSDEVQLMMMGSGVRITPISEPALLQAFGKDEPRLKGKNMQSVLKGLNAPMAPPTSTLYSAFSFTTIRAELDNVLKNSKDVNSALRDAQDKIQNYITAEKHK